MIDKELQELLKSLIEAQKKTDAQLAKTDAQLAKTDAQLAKTDAQLAKTDAKLDRLAEMYGGVSNNQGLAAEDFFYNSLKVEPVLKGISFDMIMKNTTRKVGDIEEEYDIILVNGSVIFLIEVKYRLHRNDIERFLNRKLPRFSILFPEYKDKSIHIAFASFAIQEDAFQLANEKGVTLLQRRGEVFETLAA
jgi:hypothetical protein